VALKLNFRRCSPCYLKSRNFFFLSVVHQLQMPPALSESLEGRPFGVDLTLSIRPVLRSFEVGKINGEPLQRQRNGKSSASFLSFVSHFPFFSFSFDFPLLFCFPQQAAVAFTRTKKY